MKNKSSEYAGQIFEDEYYAPAFELQAALIGQELDSMNVNPGRPYKTLTVPGMFNPEKVNRRYVENDALFRAGMSYCELVGSALQLDDIALTYRTNPAGLS